MLPPARSCPACWLQVYLLYHFERSVQPAIKKSDWERRPYGTHMNIEEMVAKQTRIERQETPHTPSASFDFQAANAFQSYVSSALAFSIKRGGILYGTGEAVSRGHDAVLSLLGCPAHILALPACLPAGLRHRLPPELWACRLTCHWVLSRCLPLAPLQWTRRAMSL